MTRRILISADPYEARAVLMEGDRLSNIEIENASAEKRKGHIYRGRVTAIEPSLEAAFVEYEARVGSQRGGQKDGFLPFDEVATRSLKELTGHGRAKSRSGLRVGDAVLVQVAKEEVGRKGATLTMNVSLPGRYVVLMPFSERTGVSRKLDGEERDRLRRIMHQISIPDGYGVIMRTSGEMTESIEEIQSDLDYLVHTWESIVHRFREAKEPCEVYSEPSLAVRFVRDYLNVDVTEILVEDSLVAGSNSASTYQELSRYLEAWMPQRKGLLKLYDSEIPLFTRFGVERQIEALLGRRVTLPSGGSIVISETEALVAIDVNSGRLKQRDAEETALATNLEAAREVARQVVLRDLGGIIVVDFIDMESEAHCRRVEEELKTAMARDKARLTFGRISDFGLLAFSRQRIRQTMDTGITLPCPTCDGVGRIRSPSSLAMTALRRVRERLATMKHKAAYVEVLIPVAVANFLNNRKREDLLALEKRYGVLIDVTGEAGCAPNDIRVNVMPDVPLNRSHIKITEGQPPAPEEPRPQLEAKTPGRDDAGTERERSLLKGLLKIVFGRKDDDAASVPPEPAQAVSETSAFLRGPSSPRDMGPVAVKDDAMRSTAADGSGGDRDTRGLARKRSGRGRRKGIARGAGAAREEGGEAARALMPEAPKDQESKETKKPEAQSAQASMGEPEGRGGGDTGEVSRRSRRRRGGRRRRRPLEPSPPVDGGEAVNAAASSVSVMSQGGEDG